MMTNSIYLAHASAGNFRALSLWTPGTKTRVRELLQADRQSDPVVIDKTVDFTRKLVALKQLFPRMLDGANAGLPDFALYAPLHDIQVTHRSIEGQLARISADLPSERLVDGIVQIVKTGGPHNDKALDRQHFRLMDITAEGLPADWPADVLLFVVLAGDWGRIDLSTAMLANADLRNVQWKNTNLQGANLTGARLSGSDLSGSNLRDAILVNADLASMTANYVDFGYANLTGANACHAIITNANFEWATLNNVRFRHATLDRSIRFSCGIAIDFTHATLFNISMSTFDRGRFAMTDAEKRTLCEGQIRTLASINRLGECAKLNRTLGRLIERDASGDHPVIPLSAFADLLLAHRGCWEDKHLRPFIMQIFPQCLTAWNQHARNDDQPRLEHGLFYLSETDTDWVIDWACYCHAMGRLQAETASAPAEQRTKVHNLFLRHPDIARVAEALESMEEGLSALCSIFISRDRNKALVYETATYRDLLRGIGSTCNGYQLTRNSDDSFRNETLRDPRPLLDACRMPPALYAIRSQSSLDLIDFILDGEQGRPHKEKFLQALKGRTLPPDTDGRYAQRIPLAADVQLIAYFADFCDGKREQKNFQLRTDHVGRLWEIVNRNVGPLDDTAANRAKMLLCLGTLFVRYSAKEIFGTDRDSLTGLRDYARACLNRSHALHSSLQGEQATKFRHTLLGASGLGQCTSILSNTLSTFIRARTARDPILMTFFNAIYPLAW